MREHPFVAMGWPVALEREDIRRRRLTFNRCTYNRALVTNPAITPEAIYRFCCDLGFEEMLFWDFKDSYPLTHIPARTFWANATSLELILLAYQSNFGSPPAEPGAYLVEVRCLPSVALPAPDVQHWNIALLRRELWRLSIE